METEASEEFEMETEASEESDGGDEWGSFGASITKHPLPLHSTTYSLPARKETEEYIGQHPFFTPSLARLSHIYSFGLSQDRPPILEEEEFHFQHKEESEKLIIPAALGMSTLNDGQEGLCPTQEKLLTRYWKVSAMPYSVLHSMIVESDMTYADMRRTIDAEASVAGDALVTVWDSYIFYQGFPDDPEEFQDVVYAILSMALQFNCDLRDTGFLLKSGGTTSDSAWKTANAVPLERLNVSLKPYTMQCIAALNLSAVRNSVLASYVRAYGLGYGLLPSRDSVSRKEYKFVSGYPTLANIRAVQKYTDLDEQAVAQFSAHLLGMFGLMHLANGHIFEPNESNMTRMVNSYRIGYSYLQTLDMNMNTRQTMVDNLRVYVRTAQQPFGLAQTYWFALVLGHHHCLPLHLINRVSVTPPPLQLLRIVNAARREWWRSPAGAIVDSLYGHHYPDLVEWINNVVPNAPAYSKSHRLYGVKKQKILPPEVQAIIDEMTPATYGFATAFHSTVDKLSKDGYGIGLALSVAHLDRDSEAMVMAWARAWEMSATETDQRSMKSFIAQQDMNSFVQMITREEGVEGETSRKRKKKKN